MGVQLLQLFRIPIPFRDMRFLSFLGPKIIEQNTDFWEKSFCMEVFIYIHKSFHMTRNTPTSEIFTPQYYRWSQPRKTPQQNVLSQARPHRQMSTVRELINIMLNKYKLESQKCNSSILMAIKHKNSIFPLGISILTCLESKVRINK